MQKGAQLHSTARATVRAAGDRARTGWSAGSAPFATPIARATLPWAVRPTGRKQRTQARCPFLLERETNSLSFFSCPLCSYSCAPPGSVKVWKVSCGIEQPPSLRSLEAVRATSADNKKTKSRAYCFLVRCSATPSDWADDAERSHRREWQRPVRASGRPGAKAAGPCLVRPRVALRPDEALEEYGHHGPSRRSHHHSIIRHHNTSLASLPSENTHRALPCAGVANTGATAAP